MLEEVGAVCWSCRKARDSCGCRPPPLVLLRCTVWPKLLLSALTNVGLPQLTGHIVDYISYVESDHKTTRFLETYGARREEVGIDHAVVPNALDDEVDRRNVNDVGGICKASIADEERPGVLSPPE